MKVHISIMPILKSIFTLIFIGLISCENLEEEVVNDFKTQEVNISGDVPYVIDLYVDAIPVEGGFTIEEQAEHASISEIIFNTISDTLRVQFIYQPESGFRGVDRVVLKECISNGAECVSFNFCEFVFTVE